VVDAQLRRILLDAANSARRALAKVDPNSIRAAQLRLQEQQLRMWARIGNVIEDGIERNAPLNVAVSLEYVDDLLDTLGLEHTAELRRSLEAQARNTMRAYLAREQLGMTLSERVYKNGQVANGRIDQIINRALLRGASARELARDVYHFISPNTPGGASYAAMRLGRTELNNSFHTIAKDQAAANPFVDKMEWALSGSHPRQDECDALVGKYRVDQVPDKPHPQCLCYVSPVTISRTAFIRNFKAGRYDSWVDGQLAA